MILSYQYSSYLLTSGDYDADYPGYRQNYYCNSYNQQEWTHYHNSLPLLIIWIGGYLV